VKRVVSVVKSFIFSLVWEVETSNSDLSIFKEYMCGGTIVANDRAEVGACSYTDSFFLKYIMLP
jgi:hypothetical protein